MFKNWKKLTSLRGRKDEGLLRVWSELSSKDAEPELEASYVSQAEWIPTDEERSRARHLIPDEPALGKAKGPLA